MSTSLKYVIKANDIAAYIGIRVLNRIPHTGLCCQVNNNIRPILLKNLINHEPICDISFDKSKVLKRLKNI